MKNIIIKISILIISLLSIQSSIFAQATWIGTFSSNWMDANNWSWTTGSGVPNQNTDVIIDNTAPNSPIVGISNVGRVRSITLSNFAKIEVRKNAQIEIHGNILGGTNASIQCIDAVNDFDATSSIIFGGINDQLIENTMIISAKLKVNKSNGNVTIGNNAKIYVLDTLSMNAAPVSIGLPSTGNLIVSEKGLIAIDGIRGSIKKSNFSDQETPPHIILQGTNRSDSLNNLVIHNMFSYDVYPQQIVGRYYLPIGNSAIQYSHILINFSNDTLSDMIQIGLHDSMPDDCTQGTFTKSHSLNFIYQLNALSAVTYDYIDTLQHPIDVVLEFQQPTLVDTSFFSINHALRAYHYDENTSCYNNVDGIHTGVGNTLQQISLSQLNIFSKFSIQSTQFAAIDSIAVTVENNGTPLIQNENGGQLQLIANVYPATANEKVLWSIIALTGQASIDTSGLITAIGAGNVYAKATSIDNASKSDSILIAIGNISVHNIDANLFSIVPNPVYSELNIQNISNFNISSILIRDLQGRVVMSHHNSQQSLQKIAVDNLEVGTYFIEMHIDNNQKLVQKFIKL